MAVINDPVLGLTIPIAGSEPGEAYAVEISEDLEIISTHTHTGAANLDGYQIPAAGLNINADVSIQNHNLTNLRSTRFTEQSSTLSGPSDLDCIYDINGNLWFNNGSGIPVQITAGAVINSSTAIVFKTIATSTNLTIPATATYNIVDVNSSSGAISITLPIAADIADGYVFFIKDSGGAASTNNITVRTQGDTMDGGSTFVLTTNYEACAFIGDGVSNWAVYPFDKTSYQSGDALVFAGTAELNLTGTSQLNIESGAIEYVQSGGVIDVESGGELLIGYGATELVYGLVNISVVSDDHGELRISSGGIQNVNTGGFLEINTGGTQNVNSGGSLVIASGSTFTSATFANFPSAVTRTLVQQVIPGAPTGGSWSYGTYAAFSGTIGSTLAIPLLRVHQGATLSTVLVSFAVAPGHSGVPTGLPSIGITRSTFGSDVSSIVPLSTSNPQILPTPGSTSIYYNSGHIQTITYTCNENNVIDDSQYIYTLVITDESGTNSQIGNAYYNIQLNFTNILSQQWSM